MRRLSPKIAVYALALILSGCGACDSISNDGNTDNGWFVYGPLGPVASGTTLPVTILDAHTGYSILPDTDIDDAESLVTEHVTIAGTSGNTLTLMGESTGESTIEFSGIADDSRRDDSFVMEAVDPTGLTLRSNCQTGTVFRGEKGTVGFTFEPFSMGEGFYPVVINPAGAATIDVEASTHELIVFDVATDAPDQITLSVDPESGLTGNTVTYDVIDPEAGSVQLITPLAVDTLEVDPHGNIDVQPTGAALSSTYCVSYPVTVTASQSCGFIIDGVFTRTAEDILASDLALVALEGGSCSIDILLAIAGEIIERTYSFTLSAPPIITPSSGSGGGGGSSFDFD